MKKLLALLLVLGMLFLVVACTPEEPDEELPNDDPSSDTPGEDAPPTPPTVDPDDMDDIGGNVNPDGSFDLPGDKV